MHLRCSRVQRGCSGRPLWTRIRIVFHGIVTEGGQTVNSIPERVVYEGYVRSFNTEQMQQLSNRLTNAASHCAMAIGGTCEVEDTPGYLPFHPCHALSEVAHQNMLAFVPEEAILKDEKRRGGR